MATTLHPGSVAASPELTMVAPLLFSPGQRWGWQFRDRHVFRKDVSIPRPAEADVPEALIKRVDARKAKAKKGASNLLWFGGVTAVAIPVLSWATAQGFPSGLAGFLFSFMGMLTVFLAFPIWLILAIAFSSAKGRLKTATENAARVERDWQARQRDADRREQERLDAIAEWGAVRPRAGTMRVDVFGGTPRGRRALMTTLGSSILGSGSPLTVLDLTGEVTGYELCTVAQGAGYSVATLLLPKELARFNLLQSLDPDQATDLLIESVYSDESGAYQERILAHRIVKAICTSLRRDLSIVRILEALRILMGEVETAKSLTGHESEGVRNLFADTYLKQAHHRLSVLEASLDPLRELGSEARRQEDFGSALTYVKVTESGPRAVQELLIRMVFGWALHRLERGASGAAVPAVVVLGADSIPRAQSERMATACESQGVALIQFFRYLRGSGAEALGGGAAAVFMRLGNPEEAHRAAEHIGKKHKFVLAQLTRTVSQNEAATQTRSTGGTKGETRSFGIPSLFSESNTTTTNWGSTEGLSKSSGFADGKAEQRVYELEVEPTEIQALPETALILVQHRAGSTNAVLADCNPDIASLPRVSPAPFDGPVLPAGAETERLASSPAT